MAKHSQVAYAMVNPTAAGLVWSPDQWPGLNPSVEELRRDTLSAGKPAYYFTGKSWAAGGPVKLRLPTQWIHGENEARDAIERRCGGSWPKPGRRSASAGGR